MDVIYIHKLKQFLEDLSPGSISPDLENKLLEHLKNSWDMFVARAQLECPYAYSSITFLANASVSSKVTTGVIFAVW